MNRTSNERLRDVARMRANFALEGLLPDEADIALQDAYIGGELTLAEMLAYARTFALARAPFEPQQFGSDTP